MQPFWSHLCHSLCNGKLVYHHCKTWEAQRKANAPRSRKTISCRLFQLSPEGPCPTSATCHNSAGCWRFVCCRSHDPASLSLWLSWIFLLVAWAQAVGLVAVFGSPLEGGRLGLVTLSSATKAKVQQYCHWGSAQTICWGRESRATHQEW